jgi:long-chain acyl-CoA synthetase
VIRALREGRATVVIGVPRLYRALSAGIEARASALGRFAKWLYKMTLAFSRLLRKYLGVRAGLFLLRPLHKQFGNSLRVTASGGAQLDPELALTLEALGWQVAIGYGLTETSPLLTINPPGRARLETVGRPIRGTDLRIDPLEHDKHRSAGQGEIVARGPGVFSGYLHLPKLTRQAFTEDGWFRTGDLGYLDKDNYLHVVGRVSTMIKTQGGEKVQPEDLEEIFAQSDVIQEIGILEDQGKLVAVVVPKAQKESETPEGSQRDVIKEAIEARSRKLPSHQRISSFAITRDPLPRTRLGKIRRAELAERYRQAQRQPDKAAAKVKRHPIEPDEMSADDRALLEDDAARHVWQMLAKRFSDDRLTPDTNLQLELGVDSLEWMNLTLEISQQAGVELEEQVLGNIETVRDLLQAVNESSSGAQDFRPEDVFDQPERFLDARQQRWLRPWGTIERKASAAGYALNRLLVRRWFHLEVTGLEHLPEKPPYIIAPNHTSYLDPLVIAASLSNQRLRHLWWTAWTGVTFANPVLRLVSRLTHTVPIEPEYGARSSLAYGAAILRGGDGLVWFPEGGLSRDGRLSPFKPGLGLLLEHLRIPVVPVLIQGTFEAMPAGTRWPHHHPVKVAFDRSAEVDELMQQGHGDEPEQRLMDALRSRVAAMQESHVVQHA